MLYPSVFARHGRRPLRHRNVASVMVRAAGKDHRELFEILLKYAMDNAILLKKVLESFDSRRWVLLEILRDKLDQSEQIALGQYDIHHWPLLTSRG